MSASKQKKIRKELYASGQLDRNPEQTRRKARRKKNRITGTIVSIIVVILLAAAVLYGSAFFEMHATALTAGSHRVSPAVYNYFYKTVYSNVTSQYGDYLSYIIDPDKSLRDQYYDEEKGETWADYFIEQTNTSIIQTYAVYDDAMANGFTLPDDQQSYLDSLPETLESYANNNGSDSAEAYLRETYGRGCTIDNYEEYARVAQIASAYSAQHSDALEYTDDEIESYYQEHKDTYDTVSYHAYLCAVKSGETDDGGNDVIDMDASEKLAKSIAEGGYQDEDRFNSLVYDAVDSDSKESYQDGSATLQTDATASGVPAVLSDWLFDTSRQSGDTTYVASDDNGCYAAFFVDNASKNDVAMVNVRHILIKPEDSTDDASVAAAKQKAQDLLDEFLAGDKTEDSFAALAEKNSEDTGSNTNGGLYENVYPGEMTTEFNDWCFDKARKAGDTGIVQTSIGFHVMYFSGRGENYRQYKIKTDMRSEDTNNWAKSLGDSLSVRASSFGMLFINL